MEMMKLRPAAASLCLAFLAVLAPARAEEEEAPAKAKAEAPASDAPRALLRRGSYAEALEGFREVAGAEGTDAAAAVEARRGWAEALAAQGKHEEALEVLKGGKDPAHASLLAFAGTVHLRAGKLEEARGALAKAVAVEKAPLGAQVEARVRLGQVHAAAGRPDEARAAFTQAIDIYKEIDGDQADALPAETFVEWGLALIGLNRFGEANELMFSQAQEKDAKCPSLLLEQGRAFFAKYNYPDSRDLYKEAIAQNSRFADAQAALAENYLTDFGAGPARFEAAEKCIAAALEVNPRCAEAYLARGGLWLYDGNYGKAMADLDRAVKENPASMRARGLLAACRLLQGDQEAFAKEEAAAKAVNPRCAEFYHTLAVALDNRFRYFDSVAMCDKALALDPEYWPAFVTLGVNCLRTGENARGRQFLERSWERDKFNVWVFNTRKLLKHMDENYSSFEEDGFVFYFPKADAPVLNAYLVPLLREAREKLEARYRTKLGGPIQVECFSEHQWFSTRTVGLPDFPASGACFGRLVTLTTPKALPQNWGAVAWHEFAHVAALALTQHRVPRWLTEGLSVYEEGLDRPHWSRNFQRDLADAWASRRLLPIGELDFGFSKPKYPMQILNSYFQGCLVVKLIVEKWGFDRVLLLLEGYRDHKGTARIFRDALGLSLEDFDREFEAFMTKWVEANGYRPKLEEEMVPLLEAKVEEDPKDARAHADLAWAYFCQGNAVDASLTAAKALELDPKSGDALAVQAFGHLREKKTRQATEALEKALEAGTRFSARCRIELGKILSRKEETRAKAIEHLEEGKKLSPVAEAGFPSQGNVYYLLAKLYEEEGQEDKAHQQMVELARFAVEDAECRQRLVRYSMERKKDMKEAQKYLEELLFIDPFEAKFHKLLARVAAETGAHDLAIRENGILLGYPDSNPRVVRLALARAYLAKGDKARAAVEAKRVLDIDPDHSEAKDILEKAK